MHGAAAFWVRGNVCAVFVAAAITACSKYTHVFVLSCCCCCCRAEGGLIDAAVPDAAELVPV
jgi:hypothetical protein